MADQEVLNMNKEAKEQLWTDIERNVQRACDTHESIDDALRSWLELTTRLHYSSPETSNEVIYCAQMLIEGPLFRRHEDYVRTQIIYSLLQEDEQAPLHAIACLLLLDGHKDKSTFARMVAESCFPRLLELVNDKQEAEDPRLHRLLLQLLYEMSRMERLKLDELLLVDDEMVHSLFQIIEGVSDDVHDPYHYPTIRVLLVLNEQYMLASTDSVAASDGNLIPVTNRIVKCLSFHGPSFRTFGENIILLLNRETETSLQLLILKLLYLLFTNKATHEYFYTNDLRVLLDVIIRNLMDLPDEKISLRHTYLRVLYPLLAHTQLREPPYYKHDEIIRVVKILRGSQNAHFAPADETTLRLVERVSKVKWIETAEAEVGSGEVEVARRLLGISLSRTDSGSSISVSDVAAVMETPGVQTPSRKTDSPEEERLTEIAAESTVLDSSTSNLSPWRRPKKPLPAIPVHKPGIQLSPNTDVQVHLPAGKKIPPKAPPPRRHGRMKAFETPSAGSFPDAAAAEE